MDLLYIALCAPLAIVAVRAWTRWARSGGRYTLTLGILACAGAIDATRMLLRRAEDIPGGGHERQILYFALAATALLLVEGWRGLGRSPSPRSPRSIDDAGPQSLVDENSTE